MRARLIILGFVILAVTGTFFLLWRSTPEQIVKRQAHRLLDCLEKGALSSNTTTNKVELLGELLAHSFTVQAPYPVDSGTFDRTQAGRSLKDFHDSVMSCAIRRDNALIKIEAENIGSYETVLSVEISLGPRRQHHFKYNCLIEFIRSGDDWIAREIILNPI
ncbi:MAG: hypothetical protein P8M65_07120 [Roseibacillus sp.]|nr:hypothetical protein [Roseibacillus sp.]